MAADAPDTNSLTAGLNGRSIRIGEVPDSILRRYYTDGRGGGLGFYADATVAAPAFRDRGDRLTTARNDPNAIRHMARIAQHRGWSVVLVRGAADFRREAWLTGRGLGLDVRGYRPSARDLQALQRRLASERGRAPRDPDASPKTQPVGADLGGPGPRSHMKAVEAVVRARVADTVEQERLIEGARRRLAAWLERGARFDEIAPRSRDGPNRVRQR